METNTPIFDAITNTANDLTYGNDPGKPIIVVALIAMGIWFKLISEIYRSPFTYLLGPAYYTHGNPIKVVLHDSLNLEIYSSSQLKEDCIKIFIDQTNIQIQEQNGEEKNTLPGS